MVYCIRWWYICFFRESKFLFRLDVRAINSIDSWQRRPSLVSLLSVRLSSLLHRHSFRACHAIFLPHGGLGDEPKECLRRRLSVGLLIYNSLVTLWSVFPYLVLCPHLNWQRCHCSYSGKGYGRLREISLPFPGSHEVNPTFQILIIEKFQLEVNTVYSDWFLVIKSAMMICFYPLSFSSPTAFKKLKQNWWIIFYHDTIS